MIERHLDDEAGIITVVADGVWTRALVDAHYAELRTMIAALRREGRQVRILSDITTAPRQTPEIETHIKWQMEHSFRPGDRVAILVEDQAVKTQMRAIIGDAAVCLFCSRMAAEMWLLADEDDADVA